MNNRANHRAQEVLLENLSVKDAIVALVGPTGAGKSSFIEKATGIDGIAGHSLESQTREISVFKLAVPDTPGSYIYLVDTPGFYGGFDDMNKSDIQIFRMISEWLNSTRKQQLQLTGLLYFHQINEHITGTAVKNLRAFEKLCGKNFHNIVLTTTMWDEVDESEGDRREFLLEAGYWHAMMKLGSSVKRFLYTRDSAFAVLASFFEEVKRRNALLLQDLRMKRTLFLRQLISVDKIAPQNLSKKDAIVAIIGPTGSGKSSFVETATGMEGLVGHGLGSYTKELSVFKLSMLDFDICLIDTPGFDDTVTSNLQVFRMVSNLILNNCKREMHLDGLLYFHRISDNRMAGTPLTNFHSFEKLCGEEYSKITLTTTMWDDVDEQVGVEREEELRTVFWEAMIKRGSSVRSFMKTRESAYEILAPVFAEVNRRSASLFQEEMDTLMNHLKSTSQKTLYSQLTQLVTRRQRIQEKIQDRESTTDLKPLVDEYRKLSVQVRQAIDDLHKMNMSITKRMWLWLFGYSVPRKGWKPSTQIDPPLNRVRSLGDSPYQVAQKQDPNPSSWTV